LMGGSDMPDTDRQRYSTIIHDETIRLTRLLDDLLDLSFLENGQVHLHRQHVSLNGIIERAVKASASIEKDSDISIVRNLTAEQLVVETDSDRLAQVFINLIANARKYCTAKNPELEIRVQEHADFVDVDFVDNGAGIPKKSQSVIFEKFSRLTDQAAAGGAGLGLAICREIMANLGGSVSYLPGQGGTAFRVRLPMRSAQAQAAQ